MSKYMCLKTYEDDKETYGMDFLASKVYEYEDGYMHSTENGTDVMIEESELQKNWTKIS